MYVCHQVCHVCVCVCVCACASVSACACMHACVHVCVCKYNYLTLFTGSMLAKITLKEKQHGVLIQLNINVAILQCILLNVFFMYLSIVIYG